MISLASGADVVFTSFLVAAASSGLGASEVSGRLGLLLNAGWRMWSERVLVINSGISSNAPALPLPNDSELTSNSGISALISLPLIAEIDDFATSPSLRLDGLDGFRLLTRWAFRGGRGGRRSVARVAQPRPSAWGEDLR